MKAINFTCVSFLLALGLAACDSRDAGGEPESTVAPEPASTAEDRETSETDVLEPAATVKFGRYVEPDTFRVGGLSTTFSTTNRVFASVELHEVQPPATVKMRLLQDGRELAVLQRAIESRSTGPRTVNFAIGDEVSNTGLSEGVYHVETSVGSDVLDVSEITVK